MQIGRENEKSFAPFRPVIVATSFQARLRLFLLGGFEQAANLPHKQAVKTPTGKLKWCEFV